MTCNLLASPITMYRLAAGSALFDTYPGKYRHAKNIHMRDERCLYRTNFPVRLQ